MCCGIGFYIFGCERGTKRWAKWAVVNFMSTSNWVVVLHYAILCQLVVAFALILCQLASGNVHACRDNMHNAFPQQEKDWLANSWKKRSRQQRSFDATQQHALLAPTEEIDSLGNKTPLTDALQWLLPALVHAVDNPIEVVCWVIQLCS